MTALLPLLPGYIYHLYNRGNNRENLFREDRNYRYFLELYARHVHPIVDTYAYCLMPNHLHLLVRMKTEAEWWEYLTQTSEVSAIHVTPTYNPTQKFANLFNAYSKAFNKSHGRTGKLFQEHFKRILVDSDDYFTNLTSYIHFNPQKHGFVADFRDWPWSSWQAISSTMPTKLQRDAVIRWFGDAKTLREFHQNAVDEKKIAKLLDEDFE